MKQRIVAALSLAIVAGCTPRADLPTGPEAYAQIPPAPDTIQLRDYYILPGDHISVSVYREPDLTIPDVPIDSAGKFSFPLVGTIVANGKTADQVADTLRSGLGTYLKNPTVAVNVITAASQHVVVEGSVNHPGVYDIRGQTTLLGVLALAQGPSRVARLDEVAIFRRANGQMLAAKFDVRDIRLGKAADPEILPNDTVVVGFSSVKGVWRDALQALPVFSLFTRI